MSPKTRRIIRMAIKTSLIIVLVMFLFGAWYKYTYSMKVAMSREINDPELATKVLIASQGSDFKDHVINGIIEKLDDRAVYISVVDVSELANVKPSDWSAIVIIHTWEMGKPPGPVSEFVNRTNASDLIILTTSGDGNYHLDGIDGITSASKPSDIDRCVREIMNRIEIRIAPEQISTFK